MNQFKILIVIYFNIIIKERCYISWRYSQNLNFEENPIPDPRGNPIPDPNISSNPITGPNPNPNP